MKINETVKKIILYDFRIFIAYVFSQIVSTSYYSEFSEKNDISIYLFCLFFCLLMLMKNLFTKTRLTKIDQVVLVMYLLLLVYNSAFRNAELVITRTSINFLLLECIFYVPLGLLFYKSGFSSLMKKTFFLIICISIIWVKTIDFNSSILLIQFTGIRLIGMMVGYCIGKYRLLRKKNFKITSKRKAM